MDDTAVNDIARFFRRLQWALVALGVLWLVWLMGPVLTPFVVAALLGWLGDPLVRSEEHTSEIQSLMRISYAVFCSTKQNPAPPTVNIHIYLSVNTIHLP